MVWINILLQSDRAHILNSDCAVVNQSSLVFMLGQRGLFQAAVVALSDDENLFVLQFRQKVRVATGFLRSPGHFALELSLWMLSLLAGAHNGWL